MGWILTIKKKASSIAWGSHQSLPWGWDLWNSCDGPKTCTKPGANGEFSRNLTIVLVGALEAVFFDILGMSSSQLTNSYFSEA